MAPQARHVAVPARESLARGRWPFAAMLLALLGFSGIYVWVRRDRTAAIDLAVSMRLQSYRWPALRRVMEAASWPGFPPQSRIVPLAFIVGLWVVGLPLEAIFLLGAWGTATLATIVKATMRRQRPLPPQVEVVAAHLGGSSFPSGHVLTYVGFYGFLAYLGHALLRPVAVRRPLVGFLTGLVGLVGPSRIYEGHHWPTDVAASYLLGLAYLIGLTALYRRFKARRAAPSS